MALRAPKKPQMKPQMKHSKRTQMKLNGFKNESRHASFGGALLKNSNAKVARPFSPRAAIHVAMRSQMASGARSMLRKQNRNRVDSIVRTEAKKRMVRVYNYANVGNHLHFLLECRSRQAFQAFLRAISGRIAMAVLGTAKGRPGKQGFWDQRPFSRLVQRRGRAFQAAWRYVDLNDIESTGWLTRREARILQMEELGVPWRSSSG